MATSPNKLSQFWHELKHRNVVRVITVYAGAAFVILELVSMSEEPFGLPDWTFVLAVALLSIGFVIAVILSWIYDIHPEGGMVKTEPAQKAKTEEIHKSSNGWKFASYISFVVIIGLVVLNIIPRTGKRESLEKSIAVLPFTSDGPESENAHYVKGYMTAVHNNLCKIKELRVLTLQSTEQYENQNKSISEIAKELGVGYLLSARGQIINSRVRLTVYLADANDDIIWTNPYDRQIEIVEDHIDIQSDIAQLVADEIQVAITPEEMELIGKIPTESLTAYDLYQRGWEVYHDYLYKDDLEALERAENYYQEALKIDPSFALAYVGLADITWEKTNMDKYFEENFLDSVLVLLNLALSFDGQSSEAYTMRGNYYRFIGNIDLAIKDFEKAISFNPNNGRAYNGLGILYSVSDFVKSLDFYHKAIKLDRGPHLAIYLNNLQMAYFLPGVLEKSYFYLEEYLKLSGDSATYFERMGMIANFTGDNTKCIEYSKKAVELGNLGVQGYLAGSLIRSGRLKEALTVYEIWFNEMKEIGSFDFRYAHRIAYAYRMNGYKEEAEFYFDKQIEYCTGLIIKNDLWAQSYFTYYDLAGVLAFRGEKELAYENLRIFNQIEGVPYWLVQLINRDVLFDSIRKEPEFQQIVRNVEAKYQAEHDRVRQWLKENDML